MSYKNKIKLRMGLGIFYLFIGVAIIFAANLGGIENSEAHSFGAIFAAIGIARVIRFMRLLKNPAAMEECETAENDEMNIEIMLRARGLAFSAYFIIGGICVTAFYFAGNSAAGRIAAYVICGMAAVYYLSYYVIRRRYA
ncbi:MAG: hypothetical protein PUB42_06375 [Firmicutes bacterium]|nr:hypothetical protein [Bacillota bacterium]